jgi:hypothetical protein
MAKKKDPATWIVIFDLQKAEADDEIKICSTLESAIEEAESRLEEDGERDWEKPVFVARLERSIRVAVEHQEIRKTK